MGLINCECVFMVRSNEETSWTGIEQVVFFLILKDEVAKATWESCLDN